jgi:hypothetical protein
MRVDDWSTLKSCAALCCNVYAGTGYLWFSERCWTCGSQRHCYLSTDLATIGYVDSPDTLVTSIYIPNSFAAGSYRCKLLTSPDARSVTSLSSFLIFVSISFSLSHYPSLSTPPSMSSLSKSILLSLSVCLSAPLSTESYITTYGASQNHSEAC